MTLLSDLELDRHDEREARLCDLSGRRGYRVGAANHVLNRPVEFSYTRASHNCVRDYTTVRVDCEAELNYSFLPT